MTDLVEIVWDIINERKVEEFRNLSNYLIQLGIDDPEIERLEYNGAVDAPKFILWHIQKAKEIMEKSGYENPTPELTYEDYPGQLRERILEVITTENKKYFGDIPDQLRRLGCPEEDIDLYGIEHINNISSQTVKGMEDPFIEDTIRKTKKILERI